MFTIANLQKCLPKETRNNKHEAHNYPNPNTTTLTLTLKNTIAKNTLKQVLVFLTNTLSLLC